MNCSFFPLPCGFPYAVQRLGHPSPALCPVRVLLVRVPLGPQPWLHQLRHRYPGFVRRLRRYYARVRLLWIVHQRLRLLTFPPRTIRPNRTYGQSRDLPVPAQGASVHARVSDHAGSGRCSHYRACPFRLPSSEQRRHPDLQRFRGSMAGLHTPLPTLRRPPHGGLRTARGRCGSLLLHRNGLAPSTPCRSPGALTRVAACTLARSPIRGPLSEGFRHFVSSMPAPVASGWSESPGGACTHWKAPPSHGAHPSQSFHLRSDCRLWGQQQNSSEVPQIADGRNPGFVPGLPENLILMRMHRGRQSPRVRWRLAQLLSFPLAASV